MSDRSKRAAAFLPALLMTVSSVLVEVLGDVSAAQPECMVGDVFMSGGILIECRKGDFKGEIFYLNAQECAIEDKKLDKKMIKS